VGANLVLFMCEHMYISPISIGKLSSLGLDSKRAIKGHTLNLLPKVNLHYRERAKVALRFACVLY